MVFKDSPVVDRYSTIYRSDVPKRISKDAQENVVDLIVIGTLESKLY